MNTVATPKVNLLAPDFYVDPWDAYRWLRDESPVHWDQVQRVWGISRYADVLAVEKDSVTYSSANGSRPQLDLSAEESMINQDDPDHQAQRKLVSRRFTPRAVRTHEAVIRTLANSVIDEALAGGAHTVEVVEQVASRLPAMVMGELLGYEPEQWRLLRWMSEATMHSAGQTQADGTAVYTPSEESTNSLREWSAATTEIIQARRADPLDDLISVWTRGDWENRRVLEEAILVIDGGAETTRTVIGSIVRELALRPHVQLELRARPELLRNAVEEFIRWVSPVICMARTVTRDHELHGQKLRAGDQLILLYPSANRDERAFERPDDFDVHRPPNHHVAFGFGTHVCLGASLARLELRVIFEQLLSRLPAWRLVPDTEPRIIPSTFARAYDAVHIEC